LTTTVPVSLAHKCHFRLHMTYKVMMWITQSYLNRMSICINFMKKKNKSFLTSLFVRYKYPKRSFLASLFVYQKYPKYMYPLNGKVKRPRYDTYKELLSIHGVAFFSLFIYAYVRGFIHMLFFEPFEWLVVVCMIIGFLILLIYSSIYVSLYRHFKYYKNLKRDYLLALAYFIFFVVLCLYLELGCGLFS
jgi:hypothetical protein